MIRVSVLVLLIGWCFSLQANEERQRLIVRLENIQSLTANFIQQTLDDDNRVEAVTGRFSLLRPLKFAWIIETPYEQWILSDGERIWNYEPDLMQATYQTADSSLEQSPAMLLINPASRLDRYYVIEIAQNDKVYYQLSPIDENNLFGSLRLVFDKDVMVEMLLQDSLGQRTLIQLSEVVLNQPLDADQFKFSPPDGVDIFEQM